MRQPQGSGYQCTSMTKVQEPAREALHNSPALCLVTSNYHMEGFKYSIDFLGAYSQTLTEDWHQKHG